MASVNTRLNIEKLDENIIQKHGGSKQVGLKQLGSNKLGSNNLVSNDDTAVAQRRLNDKQPKEKKNTDYLVKEQENKHLGVKVGENITVTGVPGQEGAKDNVAEKKKVKESMKTNLKKLLMYKAWLTRNITRPILTTARAVIDVHEGKLSLRVGSKTVTFNIGKTMKAKYSHDDYLHCVNHTAKLVREQWVHTIDHDIKWVEAEEEGNQISFRLVISLHEARCKPD
uniref:Zinc finger, CCHC-type n=1 Tax=Tanacetum cinerariifolium TaxID=118510 RepID=A0A699HQ50_TANCI|nr:hypothetical protein [Tanacetum cinerariifolium]